MVEKEFNILEEGEKLIKAFSKMSEDVVKDIGKTIFKKDF